MPASPAPPLVALHLEEGVTRADILDRDERVEAVNPAANGVNGGAAGQGAVTEGAGAAPERPFGLPARLHVAALARRRGRVLRARSDRYLYTLYTVAVFYALPVVQFVAAFQMVSRAPRSALDPRNIPRL